MRSAMVYLTSGQVAALIKRHKSEKAILSGGKLVFRNKGVPTRA